MLNNSSPLTVSIPNAAGVGAAPDFRKKRIYMVEPVASTTGLTGFPNAPTMTGTVSTNQTTSSATYLAYRRTTLTGAAGAGSGSGANFGHASFNRSNNGGFQAFIQFSIVTNVTGFIFFAGMSTVVAAPSAGETSALLNCFGMGFDSTDANNTNWFLNHNDGAGSTTRVDLGIARDTTTGFDFYISCPPGATADISYNIQNAYTKALISAGTISTNLPVADTAMAPVVRYWNGAIASAATCQISKLYVETDY